MPLGFSHLEANKGKKIWCHLTDTSSSMLLLWNYLHQQWSKDRLFLYNIAPCCEEEASKIHPAGLPDSFVKTTSRILTDILLPFKAHVKREA